MAATVLRQAQQPVAALQTLPFVDDHLLRLDFPSADETQHVDTVRHPRQADGTLCTHHALLEQAASLHVEHLQDAFTVHYELASHLESE